MINHPELNGIVISSVADERRRQQELDELNILDTENEEAFDRITRLVARLYKAPIAFISFVSRDRQWMKACIGLEIRTTTREVAFCQYVVALKETVICPDTLLDERFKNNPLVQQFGFRFYAGAPLRTKNDNIIGTLCIMDYETRPFSEKDQHLLEELAAWGVSEIELRDKLNHKIKEKHALKNELYWAANVQQQLLPKDIKTKMITIETLYHPAEIVSGDFFNFHWLSDTQLFGYVVDVMGHGIPTALQISAIRVLFSQALEHHSSLSELMQWVNQKCHPFIPSDYFISAFCFTFDFKKKELIYISAGINRFHSWSRDRGATLHRVPGMMLGIETDIEFEEHHVPLESGEQFIFYTDGFTDVLIKEGLWEPSDFNRPSSEIIKRIEEKLGNNDHLDDITAIFIEVN